MGQSHRRQSDGRHSDVATPIVRICTDQIPLGEKDAIVLFDVQNGRRAEQLASQQLARLQTPVAKEDRAALSRQLNRYEDSLAHRDYRAARARQRGWSGGDPVGFQPQITTLPQGAMLSGYWLAGSRVGGPAVRANLADAVLLADWRRHDV